MAPKHQNDKKSPPKPPPVPPPISPEVPLPKPSMDQPSFIKNPAQKPAVINPLTIQPSMAGIPEPPQIPSTTPTPSIVTPEAPTGELYHDLGVFLGELQESFADRYQMWEDSINAVLLIMRKMQA